MSNCGKNHIVCRQRSKRSDNGHRVRDGTVPTPPIMPCPFPTWTTVISYEELEASGCLAALDRGSSEADSNADSHGGELSGDYKESEMLRVTGAVEGGTLVEGRF